MPGNLVSPTDILYIGTKLYTTVNSGNILSAYRTVRGDSTVGYYLHHGSLHGSHLAMITIPFQLLYPYLHYCAGLLNSAHTNCILIKFIYFYGNTLVMLHNCSEGIMI